MIYFFLLHIDTTLVQSCADGAVDYLGLFHMIICKKFTTSEY